MNDTIATIREHYRRRVDLHRAEKRATLQIKAICRRFCDGDKTEAGRLYSAMMKDGEHPHVAAATSWCAPLILARDGLEAARKAEEKILTKAAQSLAVWPYVEAIKGFGALSLAQIVGEAGDVGSYGGPAKLWKRFGLAVFNGRAQGRPDKPTAEDWVALGYSAERRSLVFVIGDNMIRARNPEFRALYDQRKAYEIERDPEMRKIVAHLRAKRYAEKRVLRDLWRAWRAATALPASPVLDASPLSEPVRAESSVVVS